VARRLTEKQHFRIGEVAEIVGVKPHVLRYWESEFAVLAPKKTRGSHRQYSRRDVEIATRIRQLVHDEGFTIAGARKRLRELDQHRKATAPTPTASREAGLRAELLAVRSQLVALLEALDAEDEEPSFTVIIEKIGP